MNRILNTGILMLLIFVMSFTSSQAESEYKGLFEFINMYETPFAQANLTQEEQQALIVHPGSMVETQYATYTVTDAAFDGRLLHVLVHVIPKQDVLLISGYGYDDAMPIWYEDGEANGETFAQRAERENKKLVVSRMLSGHTIDEMGLEGDSYVEAFYLDGTMQLYGRIAMKEYTPVFDGKLKIEEALYGEEFIDTELDLFIEPTACFEKGVWQGELHAGPLTLTRVELNRSEIGASLWVYADVKKTLTSKEAEQVSALEALTPDVKSFAGGYYIMNEQGDMYYGNPVGGEIVLFVSYVGAGDALPEQLTLALCNYLSNEVFGEFTVPIQPMIEQ